MRKKPLSWMLTVAMVLSLLIAIPIATNAQPPDYNCQIVETGTEYANLDAALEAVTSGQTIQLLTDVTSTSAIMAYNKSFSLDVQGYSLAVTVLNQTCLYAGNGYDLTITDSVGGGSVALSASSGSGLAGLYADSYGSEIYVDVPTSVNVTGSSCYGVYAVEGGIVSLTGDINVTGTSSYGAGAFSGVYGSLITIDGEINATNYINANGAAFTGPEQCVSPTTKAGYLTFLNNGDSANPQSTVWVKEISYVCEVDGVQYETLDGGLTAAAVDEDTIKLLTDIDYIGQVSPTADTWINLNGYTLNVVNDSGAALLLPAGIDISINGEGAFNVTGSSSGVIIGEGSSARVTNATATASNGVAVDLGYANSSATILGDVTANGTGGAFGVAGYGTATIYGDVFAEGTGGTGVAALGSANVTVRGYITAPNYLSIAGTVKTASEYNSIVNNYYVYTDGSATVQTRQEVCSLDGVNYLFLEDALADAEDGDTITLLADIRYQNEIVLIEKDLHFDLATYTLDIGRTGSDGALKVDGSTLTIDDTDGGELNIVDGYVGVRALNSGTATVTSISGLNGYGNHWRK